MAVDRTCVQSFIAVGALAVEVQVALITGITTLRLAVVVTQHDFIK